MKKSECYILAQIAVIEGTMPTEQKLEVLRYLIEREDFEKFLENTGFPDKKKTSKTLCFRGFLIIANRL